MNAIKAVGDWELEVLGVPFGSPAQRDAHGEYFSPSTKFHEDKFGLPPAVYYHGYSENGKPSGSPQYIGKTIRRWVDAKGVWFQVILDKSNSYAGKVWEAAKAGMARASSGSISHLVRRARDGHITEWVVAELSVFDTYGGKDPANNYAVAIPVMKMVYQQAGLVLPDGLETDGEEAEASAKGADAQRAIASGGASVVVLSNTMEGKMEITEAVKAELLEIARAEVKAQQEAAVKAAQDAAKAQAEQEAAIKAAVDAAKAEFEKEAAKGRRLPSDMGGTLRQFAYADKYDELSAADTALLVSIVNSGTKNGASEDALKALALKIGEDKGVAGAAGRQALKAIGVDATKSNELNRSTLTSYGDEWVGQTYSRALWEKIREGVWLLNEIPTTEVPQGSESVIIPLEGTDPTFYNVPQAASTGTSGWPDATVPTSQVGTDKQTLTVGKMGARVLWTGEMEEDSLIPWVANLRRQLEIAGAEQLEHLIIDGDVTLTATTNINDIAGTPAGTELFTLFNGFRKLALITNSANSRDGGTLAVEDYLATVRLMGTNGKNASDKRKIIIITDPSTHAKSLELTEIKTRDVFSNPTIENGDLMNLWGYRIRQSWEMARLGNGLTNAAGKVDQDTPGNNTKGQILAIRPDQWLFGYKRRMTIETTRIARADSWEIVALSRVGMIYRDTEAAAISYNITV